MSGPRPIHQPHREICSVPDDAEPSFSYEQESFLARDEDDFDEEFHRRQQPQQHPSRRDSSSTTTSGSGAGSTFWRSTLDQTNNSSSGARPQFSSMSMQQQQAQRRDETMNNNNASFTTPQQPTPSDRRGSGRLGAALLAHSNNTTTTTSDAVQQQVEKEGRILASSWNAGGGGTDNNARIAHRKDSTASTTSSNSNTAAKQNKKDMAKNRTVARRLKMEAGNGDVDLGHPVEEGDTAPSTPPMEHASLSRQSTATGGSDHSGSLLYGKPVNLSRATSIGASGSGPGASGVVLGKSSSLIFPTGVETPDADKEETTNIKRRKINLLLDQCEAVRFPFKKKLILENLSLNANDVPVKDLCNTSLGNALHKLSLSGNRLSVIPDLLVQCLPVLKHLDLSQCDLHQLPDKWDLPQLKRLNLSHNRLTEFPDEGMLEGLPELQDLNMYGNKVAEIIVPRNPRLLSKLETLNLGYNDLAFLPDELDQLKALRTLKVMNNFLEKVPMRVCDMDIRSIDVSSNPVIQPPIETCERGICSMKRYYACLRLEEQSKQKALEEFNKKLLRQRKRDEKQGSKRRRFPFSGSSGGSASSSGKCALSSLTSLGESPLFASKKEAAIVPAPEVLAVARVDESRPVVRASDDAITLEEDAALRVAPLHDKEELLDYAEGKGEEPDYSSEDTSDVQALIAKEVVEKAEEVTVNDTLKVIFVGMAMAGKTSMIKRLIEGRDAEIPKRDDRTVGVDIYAWDSKKDKREEIRHVDTRIEIEDKELAKTCGDVNVKFSVWDFAGQHVYHATHELFFSPRALYVLVWDMGATNRDTQRRKNATDDVEGAFKLSYDSSDDEDDDFAAEEEARRADRALERDIDEKVQFWVDCIQSSAPGAAILPVASFDDYFVESGAGEEEAKRRCEMMKIRLLKHERRRIQGLKERLKNFENENRANDEGALRLRKLLCPYTRPKLIFGDGEEDNVVRVSGTKYTGFDVLTEKIVSIATGRDLAGSKYPIFRGHVGARIPRMRLEVREVVRSMRDRFKVVEWGCFIKTLKERGYYSAEDVSDALHFLTNIGELSYFGNVLLDKVDTYEPDDKRCSIMFRDSNRVIKRYDPNGPVDPDSDDEYEETAFLSIDDTSLTAPSTTIDEYSLSTTEDLGISTLSQYVFLNPRWLVAAVACILRHDLSREIRDTRRLMSSHSRPILSRNDSFVYDTNWNCPVITAEDACMLWQAKKFTKKAAERAQEYSNNMQVTPFDFLQRLLVRFGVFVPIDLGIEKANLAGKEYAHYNDGDLPEEIGGEKSSDSPETPNFMFLPSLLGPGEPSEVWTFKNTDSWMTTLCHCMLFPDGVPPGLMERVTASVLSSVYTATSEGDSDVKGSEGQLRVKEILCWRTAFFLKLGIVTEENGELRESFTEIFVHLVDRESHLCVGSDSMGVGMRRLVLSAKGQVGDDGRKIWRGGYLIVAKAIGRVMSEYGGLEYEKQAFCPECLAKKAVSQASSWDWTILRAAAQNGDDFMRCHHGHRVHTRLITGPCETFPTSRLAVQPRLTDGEPIVPVNDLLRAVVVVGLWNGKTRKVVRVGSGFIVDRKRGLIVTASHTLMNIWGDKRSPFGENYYGLRDGKVVVGVIPRKKESDNGDGTMAVFRYYAKIVAKDESIEAKGECHLDACVLRITTRMENDVEGDGEGCGDQPETLLLNNPEAMKREKLHHLKVTEKCELDEQVKIIGYNQGGEGLLGPGERLNRYVDFARGYVCKKFATGEDPSLRLRHRFKPREEIVVICPTIGGHSGGPCVNQQGEVIGILSRADPAEKQRCYLVPSYEWKALVKKAKNTI